jgi:hypothetical protein
VAAYLGGLFCTLDRVVEHIEHVVDRALTLAFAGPAMEAAG